MVGEAAVYVQGVSLKIAAFPSLRNFQLPDHQSEGLACYSRNVFVFIVSVLTGAMNAFTTKIARLTSDFNYSNVGKRRGDLITRWSGLVLQI